MYFAVSSATSRPNIPSTTPNAMAQPAGGDDRANVCRDGKDAKGGRVFGPAGVHARRQARAGEDLERPGEVEYLYPIKDENADPHLFHGDASGLMVGPCARPNGAS